MLITDIDPILSARAVPLECIELIAHSIKVGYEKAQTTEYKRINTLSSLAELVYADLTYSKKNCEWYNSFYNELIDISKIAGVFILPELEISPLKVKMNSMFMINPLHIHSPLLDEYYADLIDKDKERYTQPMDIYKLSRLILFDMQPQFEDFVKGIPSWLMSAQNIILQAYDTLNRRHIKIVQDGNRLRYMTSIISDKWQEVKDVPPEMDVIVKYLISNRANLAFTNE